MTLQTPPVPIMGGVPAKPAKTFTIMPAGKVKRGQRIAIYGTGGIGKTTLASLAPRPVIADVEDGSSEMSVARIGGIENVRDLRDVIRDRALLKDYDTLIIDSITKVQEMAGADVLARIRPEKSDKPAESLEDYGYGKGYRYVYDVVNPMLGDLDALAKSGKNVVLICHDITESVPNPQGEDYLQYQPKMQNSKQSNLRARLKEWVDHLLYVQYDRQVDKEGKAKGGGSRMIYTQERATFLAKSRLLRGEIPFAGENDDTLWKQLFEENK